MNINDWYTETVSGDSVNRVAQRSGIAQTTLNGQRKAGRLTAETVAAIAVAYDRDVLDALVIAGLITHEQIKRHGVRAALEAATDQELSDEVWRRMSAGRGGGKFD